MQKLRLLILFLVLLPMAVSANDIERYPALQINGTFYSIDCLCVDGDSLRHKDTGKEALRPIVREERFCKKWDTHSEKGGYCLEWGTFEVACPLTYTIKVLYMDGESEKLIGTKSFTIPKCSAE